MPAEFRVADPVLRRRRAVIDIAGVDVRAMVEQEIDDRRRRGEVQRPLAVAPRRMDQRGILREPCRDLVEHPQPGRGVNVDDGAALDQPSGLFGIRVVQHTEAAGPPVAAGVDVRAEFQQRLDRRAVLLGCDDRLSAEMEQRPVDVRAKRRRVREQRSDLRRVPRFDGFHELVDLRHGAALDQVGAHLGGVVGEHADGAAPELAVGVDVRAEFQQDVDHRAIAAAMDNRRRRRVEDGTVDPGAQLRVSREQCSQAAGIAFLYSVFEEIHLMHFYNRRQLTVIDPSKQRSTSLPGVRRRAR